MFVNRPNIFYFVSEYFYSQETFGSSYKAERMSSLASALSRTDADLVALEELWMESDHTMLEEALKESGGFNVTGYRQLATAECEGWIGPLFCSGQLGRNSIWNSKSNPFPKND